MFLINLNITTKVILSYLEILNSILDGSNSNKVAND
tara:strand:- start:7994 stop:8101 length:108 start_codon:yes stop_codon:yes gene_type:complete